MRYQPHVLICALVMGPLSAVLALSGGCGGGGSSSGSSAGTAATSGGGSASTATGGMGGAGGSASAGTGGASTTGTAGTASGTASTGSGAVAIVPCQGHVYECGDLVDNDGDGLKDSDDPDCLGPCDNTEGSYFGGIPGQAGPACTVDCYFDQDSGSGNDDCHWNHKCDPHEVAPGYYPESIEGNKCSYDETSNTSGTDQTCDQLYNKQSKACLDFCGPLTPNGCDCFGCCELPAGKGNYVWLGSVGPDGLGSCDIPNIADPSKCQPCLPVAGCLNHCDPCELCIGKTTLPPECNPGSTTSSGSSGAGGSTSSSGTGGGEQCSPGVQACGLPGQSPCPAPAYCITGCCQVIPG